MSSARVRKQAEDVDRRVAEMLDAEWRAAGVSDEELRQDQRISEALARKIAAGEDVDALLTRWQTLTPEEILREDGMSIPCDDVGDAQHNCDPAPARGPLPSAVADLYDAKEPARSRR